MLIKESPNHTSIMKNLFYVSKRSVMFMAAGLLGVMALSSCLKNNDNNATPSQPVALLSVINAVPDAPASDFYLDNNKVNLNAMNYNSRLDYFKVVPGKRGAIFYATGTTNKLFADSVTLTANQAYSLFVSNTTASPKFLLLTDTIKQPSSGNASIRLVDVSPDAGDVDLAVTGGPVLASHIGYNQWTGFIPVGGGQTYTIEVRQAGTTTVLAKLTNATLATGSVYTVWLHGLVNTTDATKKLTVDALLNAYY